jgi:hypothetical protein
MAYQDSDFVDLIQGTQKQLGEQKFTNIATRLQSYEIMGKLLKEQKLKFDGGTAIQRNALTDHSDSARMVGLAEVDVVNIPALIGKYEVPWRHTTASYAYERRELLMNNGDRKILDLVKTRMTATKIALAELMETQGWTKPVDSTDGINLWGIPTFVVKNATAGFTGTNPSGYTGGYGSLSSTTYPRWANYAGPYTNVTKADLIKSMRTASRKTNWKSPVDINDYRTGTGQEQRIYVNEATMASLEDVGESANENLGRDLSYYDDDLTFKKHAIKWVPKLDADTTNPVYMLNLADIHIVCLEGDYMYVSDPKSASGNGLAHTVFAGFIDLTWNMVCDNRRTQAVLSL